MDELSEAMDFELTSCLLNNPPGPRLCCHSASILETHSRNLIAVWYAYEKEETEGAVLVIAQKHIEDRNWGMPRFVFKGGIFSLGNPCLYQEKGSRIWLIYVSLKRNYWNSANINGVYSDDEGRNWSSSQLLWLQEGVMIRHNPIALDEHHMLMAGYDENSAETILFKSESSFSQWREIYRFKNFPLFQPALIRLGRKELLMFFRPQNDPRLIWRSFSMDNGRTWADPVKTYLKNPLSGLDAVAWKDKILLFYNSNEKVRWPLSVSCSDDKGLSWTRPVSIENPGFEVSYPSFILGSDHNCHGVFTYNRRKIKYVSFPTAELCR